MSIEIRLARSKEDLRKLFRFRYAIYVEEMGQGPVILLIHFLQERSRRV